MEGSSISILITRLSSLKLSTLHDLTTFSYLLTLPASRTLNCSALAFSKILTFLGTNIYRANLMVTRWLKSTSTIVALMTGLKRACLPPLVVLFFMPRGLVVGWKSRRRRSSAETLMRVIVKEYEVNALLIGSEAKASNLRMVPSSFSLSV